MNTIQFYILGVALVSICVGAIWAETMSTVRDFRNKLDGATSVALAITVTLFFYGGLYLLGAKYGVLP